MDVNSPEFYTLAFVIIMVLLMMFLSHREKGPASTYILQLATTPDEDGDSEDAVSLEPQERGRVLLSRTGFSIGAEETVNLVITIRDQECTIIEKKGVKRRGAVGEPASGQVVLKCLRPGTKYRIRYESQLTSAWATFTFDTASPQSHSFPLKY